jgi:hypothetical protein
LKKPESGRIAEISREIKDLRGFSVRFDRFRTAQNSQLTPPTLTFIRFPSWVRLVKTHFCNDDPAGLPMWATDFSKND